MRKCHSTVDESDSLEGRIGKTAMAAHVCAQPENAPLDELAEACPGGGLWRVHADDRLHRLADRLEAGIGARGGSAQRARQERVTRLQADYDEARRRLYSGDSASLSNPGVFTDEELAANPFLAPAIRAGRGER